MTLFNERWKQHKDILNPLRQQKYSPQALLTQNSKHIWDYTTQKSLISTIHEPVRKNCTENSAISQRLRRPAADTWIRQGEEAGRSFRQRRTNPTRDPFITQCSLGVFLIRRNAEYFIE